MDEDERRAVARHGIDRDPGVYFEPVDADLPALDLPEGRRRLPVAAPANQPYCRECDQERRKDGDIALFGRHATMS